MVKLQEWAVAYLKHRDIFEKQILSIEEEEGKVLVEKKSGKEQCLIAEELADSVLAELPKSTILVTKNTKENVAFLIKHWKEFLIERLRIVFVNVSKNEKWIIIPKSHDRVAEPESLALGIQALFEAVPEG